jgi:penicillin-binding protein 2
MIRLKKNNKRKLEIEPDEIFLDSSNIPNFNTQQFEGRIERTISRTTPIALGVFISIVFILLASRAAYVQLVRGDDFMTRSEDNRLHSIPIFANRGVIEDRNGVPLAFNVYATTTGAISGTTTNEVPRRTYINEPGFSHILGYVSYPKKDASGVFWQDSYIGREGLEKQYNDILSGVPGKRLIEVNAKMNVVSSNLSQPAEDGKTLKTSIDSRVQKQLYNEIKALSEKAGFVGGAGVIMDVHTGEVLALTSYPEYDSNTITNTPDTDTVRNYFTRKDTPLLNRAVQGVYTPGSVVKPFMALAALRENLISPDKKILSTGAITIPNRFGGPATVFRDWKAHGWVNMREAIASSCDVYFYAIGGGYQDQKGLGIDRINEYMRLFKMEQITGIDLPGEKSGTIPSQPWKREKFPDNPDWNIGNTYHTSIGQFGFQMSTLELVKAVAALANGGVLVTPHLAPQSTTGVVFPKEQIEGIDPEHLQIVREGMRECVINQKHGTCKVLNVPGVTVAAKSGTAELGISKQQVNSWITGYFPYENPKYAFAIMMERADVNNTFGATFVMKGTLNYMVANTPEHIK